MSTTTFLGRRVNVLVEKKGAAQPISLFATGDDRGLASFNRPSTTVKAPASMFDKLHVKFKAEKDNLGHPNTLVLEIYNLSAKTRGELQDASGYVKLLAGYASDAANLPIVFQGVARTIDHERIGPDWVTKIQCGDGETAYRFGTVSKSWGAGTSAIQVAQDLAAQIKAADSAHIDTSDFLRRLDAITFPVSQFVYGFSATGNAFEELQKLVGGKYELSIQDGELRCLPVLVGTQNVVLIDGAHGMIGSPVHGSPNANGLPSVLKVKVLLQAKIRPGDLVSVAAKNIKGTFRVQKITHTGDLAGNEWESDIECIAAGATT